MASELELAQRAADRGLIAQAELDLVLAERRRLLKEGLHVGVREILLDRGLLDRARWESLSGEPVPGTGSGPVPGTGASSASADATPPAPAPVPRPPSTATSSGGLGGELPRPDPGTGGRAGPRPPEVQQTRSDDDRQALPPSPPRQEVLGGYRVVSELGRGAMGIVYEAVQERLGRRVALKVLPQTQALQGVARERFVREAQATASLRHSGIVPIYDVGEERGVHFFAMELVEGRSLKRVLDEEGRLEPARAAQIIRESAEALDFAHEHGVVHRDVKPDNIIERRDGTVVVTDFGLAQRERDAGLTREGTIVGTPLYMSPEQARGDGSPVDRRADVYGLGVTLYELLAGAVPFEDAKDTGELLERVTRDDPPPLSRARPDCPPALAAIVEVAVEKDPARRYQTARALADDLGRFLAGEPIHARPPSRGTRLLRAARRRARPIGVGLLTLAVSSAFLIGVRALSLRWNADALVLDAINLAQGGQREEAQKKLDEALRLWPSLAEAHYRRGELAPDRAAARAEYDAALAVEPDHVEALLARGALLDEDGDREGALRDYAAARRKAGPSDPRPMLREGLTLVALERPQEATSRLEEGVDLARSTRATRGNLYAAAVHRLGALRLAAGDAAGALAELEEAVRLLPLEVEPQLQLALALTARGNDPAAVEALSAALRREPNNQAAFELRGRAERRLGAWTEAFRDLSAAAERPSARLARGVLRFETVEQLGPLPEVAFDDLGAAQDLGAVATDPRVPARERALAHVVLGWLELASRSGYRTRAVESFDRAIQLWPTSLAARLARGLTLVEWRGHEEEARMELEQAGALPNGAYAAKVGLARLAEGRGELDLSRRLLDEAVALAPARTTAYGYRYRLRLRRGEPGAREDYDRAIARAESPTRVVFDDDVDPLFLAEQAAQRGFAAFVDAVKTDELRDGQWRHLLTRAEALLGRALLFDPWSLPASARRASVLYLLARFEPAAVAFEQARVVDPALVEADVARAVLQRDLLPGTEPAQAEATLRKVLGEAGLERALEGGARYELARALVDQGKLEEALAELDLAAQATPRRHAVASLRARVIQRLGRPGLEEAVERASALFYEGERDRLRGRLYCRAGVYLENADQDRAADHFLTRAIEADPLDAMAWRARAAVRFRGSARDLPSAFIDTFIAAELEPGYANRFLEIETRLVRFRPFLGTIESRLDEIIGEAPDVPAASFFKGYVVFQLGRVDEAERWFDRTFTMTRERSAAALTYRGAARMRAGRLPEARADLERARAMAPESPIVAFWRAALQARDGQGLDALRTLEEAAARGHTFVEQIKVAPEFDDLRQDPRLKKLVGAR